jgi:hypothetical protein
MKRLVKIILPLTLIVAVVAAFYWNEARKEIVFLCGNFEKGVSEQGVIRQLDTGSLLRYHTENVPSGKRIIVDSAYNLSMYKCIIDIDVNGKVEKARLE